MAKNQLGSCKSQINILDVDIPPEKKARLKSASPGSAKTFTLGAMETTPLVDYRHLSCGLTCLWITVSAIVMTLCDILA